MSRILKTINYQKHTNVFLLRIDNIFSFKICSVWKYETYLSLNKLAYVSHQQKVTSGMNWRNLYITELTRLCTVTPLMHLDGQTDQRINNASAKIWHPYLYQSYVFRYLAHPYKYLYITHHISVVFPSKSGNKDEFVLQKVWKSSCNSSSKCKVSADVLREPV